MFIDFVLNQIREKISQGTREKNCRSGVRQREGNAAFPPEKDTEPTYWQTAKIQDVGLRYGYVCKNFKNPEEGERHDAVRAG